MGSNIFGDLNRKSAMIGFCEMTLGLNGVLRYGNLSDFLKDKMANLSMIDYLFDLYININVTDGQN